MDCMNRALFSHGQQIFRGICLPKLGMNLISAILSSYWVPNCISVCLILLKTLSFLSTEERESGWVGKLLPSGYIYPGRETWPWVWAWDRGCQPLPFLTFCSIQETGQGIRIWKPGLPCSAGCLLQDILSSKVYSVPDPEDLMCPFCSYKISAQTILSPSQHCLLREGGSCLQSE